jgi:hypothetical protein
MARLPEHPVNPFVRHGLRWTFAIWLAASDFFGRDAHLLHKLATIVD